MTYTEKQKVERVKTALFEGWKKLASINGEDRITETFKKSIYLLNYKVLEILCINEEKHPADNKMSNILFDLYCIYEFMESVENSLKNEDQ